MFIRPLLTLVLCAQLNILVPDFISASQAFPFRQVWGSLYYHSFIDNKWNYEGDFYAEDMSHFMNALWNVSTYTDRPVNRICLLPVTDPSYPSHSIAFYMLLITACLILASEVVMLVLLGPFLRCIGSEDLLIPAGYFICGSFLLFAISGYALINIPLITTQEMITTLVLRGFLFLLLSRVIYRVIHRDV